MSDWGADEWFHAAPDFPIRSRGAPDSPGRLNARQALQPSWHLLGGPHYPPRFKNGDAPKRVVQVIVVEYQHMGQFANGAAKIHQRSRESRHQLAALPLGRFNAFHIARNAHRRAAHQ